MSQPLKKLKTHDGCAVTPIFKTRMKPCDNGEQITMCKTWMAEESANFFWELSKHINIEGGELLYMHHCFDTSDMAIIEQAYHKIQPGDSDLQIKEISDELATRLSILNKSKPDKNCFGMLSLLIRLWKSVDKKQSLRHVNTKLSETLSQWITPLHLINTTGYFRKQSLDNDTKKIISNVISNINRHNLQTNTNPENKLIVKLMLKYTTHKHMFWCDPDNCIVSGKFSESEMFKTSKSLDEPERLIQTLCLRRGDSFVKYLNGSVLNLSNTYISEIINSNSFNEDVPYISIHSTTEELANVLKQLIDDITAVSKGLLTIGTKKKKTEAPCFIRTNVVNMPVKPPKSDKADQLGEDDFSNNLFSMFPENNLNYSYPNVDVPIISNSVNSNDICASFDLDSIFSNSTLFSNELQQEHETASTTNQQFLNSSIMDLFDEVNRSALFNSLLSTAKVLPVAQPSMAGNIQYQVIPQQMLLIEPMSPPAIYTNEQLERISADAQALLLNMLAPGDVFTTST
ncbi:hypothetical protein BX661DRAFT_187129 [Kickxella alabastrina]|uniref:uncharacterized protein n=1 Tax=Kickxella alabastrina TaxID=61397 RepID=UPI002220D287|nr:uncharacterized protein BX661DRAFT_187129 [Kickxella alabastrina]KAI7822770.1 hypothetical protein BX661DRAFT_187129 [Kickxella alabastrina]